MVVAEDRCSAKVGSRWSGNSELTKGNSAMPRRDVVILGGGPAGTAAAIACASVNLRATLLERAKFARATNGETLHPNVEPILEHLGVLQPVLDAKFLRHPGVNMAWDGPEVFDSYGRTEVTPALGFQVCRADFDAILLDRARELGVEVIQPGQATAPIVSGGRMVGVTTRREPLMARFTIDATGHRRILADWLKIPTERHGPRRRTWSGQTEGSCDAQGAPPSLRANDRGWTWVAQVRESTFAWTHHDFGNRRPVDGWVPDCLQGTTPTGPNRSHDVTWRLSSRPAGPGYFLVGDAAANLDPASSHGVLEALMSGLLAGYQIVANLGGDISSEQAAARYTTTVREWFHNDRTQLSDFYQRLKTRSAAHPILGLGQTSFRRK